jgi:hypothetical protein
VSLGFVVEEGLAGAGDDLSLFVRERADGAAFRAGLLAAEVFGRLSFGGIFKGAGEQRLHGGHGDIFHLSEGDIGPGSVLAPVPADDDFSPAVSEFLNAAKILGYRFVCGHDASCEEFP